MGPNFAVIITSRIFQKTAIEPLCSIVTSVSNLLDYWVHRKSRLSPTSTILPSFWHHICIMLTRNLLRSTENVKNVVISCRSSLSECFRRSVEASQFAGVAQSQFPGNRHTQFNGKSQRGQWLAVILMTDVLESVGGLRNVKAKSPSISG